MGVDAGVVLPFDRRMSISTLPLSELYQLGFVTLDLEAAMARMRAQYGIPRFRRSHPTDWLETAHAYVGDSMIELLAVGADAPPLYAEMLPAPGMVTRLHHLGRFIHDAEGWQALQTALVDSGLPVPVNHEAMGGGLKVVYVDTRADLGVYSEYVWLSGAASGYYDDVPRY
jgi:hypothetical protein